MSKESLTFISNTEQILDIYKTVVCHKFSFNEQKKLHIIFYEYKDKTKNNISILEIIDTTQMISGLKKSLLEIINIYKSNLNLFDKVNTYSVCYQELQPEKAEYDICYKEVATLKTRKIKNGNYADSAWYGGNKTEYERYMKIDEALEVEINKASMQKDKYDRIYKEKYENVMQYRENIFSDVIELVNSYVVVLENYIPTIKEKESKEFSPITKTGLFFDMKLISLIHNECNNIQFNNLSEIDLYAILNLQSSNAKLSIKSGEKTRMCYLIYRLYEYLKTDNRKEWRTTILKSAGIEEKHYNSKYKQPESEIPSRKSECFAQRINKIFEYIS